MNAAHRLKPGKVRVFCEKNKKAGTGKSAGKIQDRQDSSKGKDAGYFQ